MEMKGKLIGKSREVPKMNSTNTCVLGHSHWIQIGKDFVSVILPKTRTKPTNLCWELADPYPNKETFVWHSPTLLVQYLSAIGYGSNLDWTHTDSGIEIHEKS